MVGRSSQVARGLNTIAANITQNQDALAAYGISVEDANGNLKSTFDVLNELKPKWDEMSDAERVALGVTLAGKNQYKVLASVMQNFSTATEATATALNSSGSAARENARYMESIEARVTAVSAAFQKMSTAVVDSDLVKGILDIIKAMAEFGSTDFGAAVTQFVLLSGLSWGGLQLLGQSILPSIMSSFGATEVAIIGFKTALSASLPVILAITAAIVSLVAIIKAIKTAYDEANPSIEKASLNMKNAQNALKEAEEGYDKANEKLNKLNTIEFEDRTSEIQAEIEALNELISYYETLIDVRSKEAKDAAKSYTESVEKNGFATNEYSAFGTVKNIEALEYGGTALQDWQQNYSSLEAAIYGAANAALQFNGIVVDTTNLSQAQQQLENYGFVFTQQTKTIPDLTRELNSYFNEMRKGEEFTPALIDKYTKLIDLTSDYAEALRISGEGNLEFLSIYDNVKNSLEALVATQTEAQNVTKEEIASRYEAASALSAYAQELINAANAYQIFKDRLAETGDYDDSFKGFSSILSEVISEFDAGQIGSQAFLTGLELLTGQTMASAEAVEYMNTHLDTLKLLFSDAENGGTGLLTALEDLGLATLDADGNLQISIDDFAGLADQLGISEGALYSLIEALRVMGVDFQYNVEDILGNIKGLGEGIVSVQDGITHIDFAEFVTQAQKLDMTNEEIQQYQSLLEKAANTELDNVSAGLDLLAQSTDADTDAVTDLDSALDDVAGFDASTTVGGLSAIGRAASDAAGNVGALADALAGLGSPTQNAEGTAYAKEGASLVNEEGPELIQSGDEAYIAGGGYPTVTHLHEGDKVYTAEETKDILKGGKLSSPIQAHGLGTRVNTNDGGSGRKKVSSIGVEGGTASVPAAILAGLNRGTGGTSGNSGGSSSASSASSDTSDIKAEFEEWLKAKKHALAMDEITEAEYYKALGEMNDKYFKDKEEYQTEYWKYQEQIYAWEKKQEEQKAKDAEKKKEEEEKQQEEAEKQRQKAAEDAEKQRQKEAEAAEKAYKEEFAEKLKDLDHALAMDEISQEEYYDSLAELNDKYFKNKEQYQDDYRKYQEKIYAWEKKQEEQRLKDEQKQEEERLKAEEKAKEEAEKAYKAEFDTWLKNQKHALAMDEITQEEYYASLKEMNEKYFKDKEQYLDEYNKYEEEIYSWEKKQQEELIKQAEALAKEQEQAYRDEFSTWLKNQSHALAMDEITQEEYYTALEEMNEKYFKGKEEYQDEYRKYEEQIYSWRKKQAEEEAKAQEEALKNQIELEKKLNDLEKAKATRVKVFQDGQFRYVSDREAVAKAQAALSGYASGTFSASGGLSLVGENGAEMRVLNKGDGIIPSALTKNLWAWGSINPKDFKSSNSTDMYNFDIDNLSLPNIKDAESFVSGLKSFALQYVAQRG